MITLFCHDSSCSTSSQWIWDVTYKLYFTGTQTGSLYTTLSRPNQFIILFCTWIWRHVPLLCESPFSVQFSNSGQNHLETPPLLDLTWVCQAAWDKTDPLVSLYPLMQTPTPRNNTNIRLSMVHILHSFQHLGVWIRRVWYKSSEIMRSVSTLSRIWIVTTQTRHDLIRNNLV